MYVFYKPHKYALLVTLEVELLNMAQPRGKLPSLG